MNEVPKYPGFQFADGVLRDHAMKIYDELSNAGADREKGIEILEHHVERLTALGAGKASEHLEQQVQEVIDGIKAAGSQAFHEALTIRMNTAVSAARRNLMASAHGKSDDPRDVVRQFLRLLDQPDDRLEKIWSPEVRAEVLGTLEAIGADAQSLKSHAEQTPRSFLAVAVVLHSLSGFYIMRPEGTTLIDGRQPKSGA